MPEELRMPYYRGIREVFPDIALNIVGHSNEAAPFIAQADVLVTFGTPVSDEILAEAKRLKWVQLLSTGVDGIVSRPSLGKDVIVTNIPGIHATSVSEAAIMFMLALSRDLPRAVHDKDRHMWDRWSSPILEGKTVGILGVGLIAEGLAPRCKALGMRVVGITAAPRSVAGFDAMHDRNALLKVLPSLDYLVLLTPYTTATHALINDAVFAAMKPKSYFINLARGKVVNERALIAALDSGRLAGAATDVVSTEPLPPEDPLWDARNLIIMPHLAAMYDEYAERALLVVNANLRRFIAGDAASMVNRVSRRNA
jgi:D-2-hydroxyacid dehydrogenase (NADP+)